MFSAGCAPPFLENIPQFPFAIAILIYGLNYVLARHIKGGWGCVRDMLDLVELIGEVRFLLARSSAI